MANFKNQINQHIINNKRFYIIGSIIFLAIAFFMFQNGRSLLVPIETQSVFFGVSFGFLNLGVLIAIAGAVLIFLKKPAFKLIGWVLLVGGFLMAGGGVIGSFTSLLNEIGILGQTIIALALLAILIKITKK